MLPQISPSPLTSLKEPISHPNWVFEMKEDGFRGILYMDREQDLEGIICKPKTSPYLLPG